MQDKIFEILQDIIRLCFSVLRSIMFHAFRFCFYGSLAIILHLFLSIEISLMITILFAIIQVHEDIIQNRK
jgi:hypothetical protein